jgi:AAA15 family ATPase/GTPase
LIVDELEKSLHPMLVEYITKLFNNNNLNIYGSQMIFTTHLTNLMNIELLRRDQIWFVEKDVKTGSSNLYSLDSFSIRKDENIYKGYLSGRYGAVPYIKEEVTW